jgi:hypothetical protein
MKKETYYVGQKLLTTKHSHNKPIFQVRTVTKVGRKWVYVGQFCRFDKEARILEGYKERVYTSVAEYLVDCFESAVRQSLQQEAGNWRFGRDTLTHEQRLAILNICGVSAPELPLPVGLPEDWEEPA